MLSQVQTETYFEFWICNCLINVIPEEERNTEVRHKGMTLSLNRVSIKMKWQNQANEYNIPKQDMYFEKKSADFI